MRSLIDSQWERYFELIAHLKPLSPDRRRAALRSLRGRGDHPGIVSLAEQHFGLTPEPDRYRTGEQLKNFVIGERLGHGGMGVVYRAVQVFSSGIERDVALKLIHPGLILRAPEAAL